MNEDFLNKLIICETDVSGALNRLNGNEKLYLVLLNAFLEDNTIEELETSIENSAWDEAFTAAHALKGLAGNMGFVPLFHSIGELVMFIRSGRIDEIGEAFKDVKKEYDSIVIVIKEYCV